MNDVLVPDWNIRKVGILSTGSEIMQGQYADSNARFLAEEFTARGIAVSAITAAPDDDKAIERAIGFLASSSDLIVCTGGLGPTADDVNRFVFERCFGATLQRDERAIDSMARRFVSRGLGPMPEANEVQAMLPVGCVPLYNKWGTAAGFLLPPTGSGVGTACGLLALPGPPSEMMPMFHQLALPALAAYLPLGRRGVVRTIHTFGYPESQIGALVKQLFAPAENVEFTILAKVHGVDLRIKATGDSDEAIASIISKYETDVRRALEPQMIYGVDDDTLPRVVGQLLKQRGAWVTTAESCTGGMISQMLTDIPGSSDYIGECHITYSNEAKVRLLNVSQASLNTVGAVSEEVASQMAEGARAISGADYAISVTGISGPGGGTVEKPVGLTYIGVAGPERTTVLKQTFTGTRSQNRLSAAQYALNFLRLELLRSSDV